MLRAFIARFSAQSPTAFAERVRRATGADSVVLGERLQALWGGYGELWRAELWHGATLTRVVVKRVQPPRDDASRSHRRKLRSYDVELAFYRAHAARCREPPSCRVPRALQLLTQGWAPGQYDSDPYSERLTREVLARFTSG